MPVAFRCGSRIAAADRSSFSIRILQKFLAACRKRPELAGVASQFSAAVPQIYADVDRDKVLKQGVAVADVYQTLQAYLGGLFLNQFNRFGRQWRVFLQAEGEERRSDRGHPKLLRAEQRGHDGSALGARHHAKHQRPGVHEPFQSLSRRAGHRRRRARLQFRPGDGRARGGGAKRSCRPRWATTGRISHTRRGERRGPR